MAANRIKIAQDKAELVKSLVASKDTSGIFQTYVEVMVFAASLGVKYKKSVPLGDTTKREPSPIPQENFASLGYDKIIKLLGIVETSESEGQMFRVGQLHVPCTVRRGMCGCATSQLRSRILTHLNGSCRDTFLSMFQ